MDSKEAAELINIEMALTERLRSDRVRVPPYPAVAAQVQVAVQNDRIGTRELAVMISTDAALSAALIRRARSAQLASGTTPPSLEGAVSKLGSQQLVEVVIAATIGVTATQAGVLSGLRRDAWRRSLLAARLCHALAPRRGISPATAFIAGLLHDFGEVVVIAALEEVATQRRLGVMPEHTWAELVDRFHVEYGTVVAARWNLPASVTDVVARHHLPDAIGDRGLVGLVATVDRLMAVLEESPELGLAGLAAIPGMTDGDLAHVHLALGETMRQLDALELGTAAHASVVAPLQAPDAGWPIELAIELNHVPFRMTAVWPDRFTCRGAMPAVTNWLSEVVIETAAGPTTLLANVRGCERDPATGDYIATARPYALGGPELAAWLHLIASARDALPRSAIAHVPDARSCDARGGAPREG